MTNDFKKWQCMSCGEIYDEELGLPYDGIPAGTRFEDLPHDWLCLSCGSEKSDFVLLDDH